MITDHPLPAKGAGGQAYGTAGFRLRQAQPERILPLILSTAPFVLSPSKHERLMAILNRELILGVLRLACQPDAGGSYIVRTCATRPLSAER
jgi:hypothetical protein